MFTRIVLFSIASLMLVYAGFRDPSANSLGFSGHSGLDSASLAGQPEWQYDTDLEASTAPHGVVDAVSIRPRLVDLDHPVSPHLRDAVWAQNGASNVADWHLDETGSLAVTGMQTLARLIDTRLAAFLLAFCAFLFALRAYWLREIRSDLLELTTTLRTSLEDAAPPPANRPRELQSLARTLGELMRRRNALLEDQSDCFAGFLRQIESRAARLRAYAMNVARWNLRVALVEDIDLFQDVARQFVETAARQGQSANHAPVSVETWLRDRYVFGAQADDARIVLKLEAGDDFQLPRSALSRLVENLVGNALAHGAPPVEIRTARGPRAWSLSVRDHGGGIGMNTLDENVLISTASVTSLKLGTHWGMGLSIVRRLARQCNAKLKIGDHPDGGLWVRLIVPTDKALDA